MTTLPAAGDGRVADGAKAQKQGRPWKPGTELDSSCWGAFLMVGGQPA